MTELCSGMVKISKQLQKELDKEYDACFSYGPHICSRCRKNFCVHHLKSHECKYTDDNEKVGVREE